MPELSKIIYTIAAGLVAFFGHSVWSTANEAHDKATKNESKIDSIIELQREMRSDIKTLLTRK